METASRIHPQNKSSGHWSQEYRIFFTRAKPEINAHERSVADPLNDPHAKAPRTLGVPKQPLIQVALLVVYTATS
jgi:hypothetical protein